MSASTGTSSASLLPPMKLYLARPVHLVAGGGKPGANSGAKSNEAAAMLCVSCRKAKPSIATAPRLSPTVVLGSTPPSLAGLTTQVGFIRLAHVNAQNRINPISKPDAILATGGRGNIISCLSRALVAVVFLSNAGVRARIGGNRSHDAR